MSGCGAAVRASRRAQAAPGRSSERVKIRPPLIYSPLRRRLGPMVPSHEHFIDKAPCNRLIAGASGWMDPGRVYLWAGQRADLSAAMARPHLFTSLREKGLVVRCERL